MARKKSDRELPDPEISMGGRSLDHRTPAVSTENIRPGEINETRKGLFVVVDGLDGIGKGEMETALRRYEERLGKAVFDSIAWSKAMEELPQLSDFWGIPKPHFNTVMTAEPTYEGIGRIIREEITARNPRNYSAEMQVQAYSINRLVQMKRVVVPAIEHGLNVIQSRCCAATLTYQVLKAMDENRDVDEVWEGILTHEGNAFQLMHAPDLLIIPTIRSLKQLTERLTERGATAKEDDSIFENAKFQARLKPLYEQKRLRYLFEEHGTKVAYIDAGRSIGKSRMQAVEVYKHFLERGEVPKQYRTVKAALARES